MGCSSANIFMKLAFPVSCLALLFHLIGYGTNSWQRAESRGETIAESGLWQTCNYILTLGCREYDVTDEGGFVDELRTVRAFTTIALIILGCVSVALLLTLIIDFFKKRLFLILEMAASVGAGVVILIAVIIYGSDLIPSNTMVYASWSLALTVVAAVLSFVTAVLIIIGAIKGKKDSGLPE